MFTLHANAKAWALYELKLQIVLSVAMSQNIYFSDIMQKQLNQTFS